MGRARALRGPRAIVAGPDANANTEARIVVAGLATLTLDDAAHELDPGGPASGLAPLLGLYRRQIASCRVEDDGTVAVAFAGGAALRIRTARAGRPPPRVEAVWMVRPGVAR